MKFLREIFSHFMLLISLCYSESLSHSLSSNSDCYVVKGTTMRLEDTHVDKYLSVTSVEECMKECDHAFLDCKSFSYKEDPDSRLDANCLLSRESSETLNTRDSRDFNYNDDFTFYEKSKSIECERKEDDHNLALERPRKVDRKSNHVDLRLTDPHKEGRDMCFKRIATGKRVTERLVDMKFKTRTRQECEQECLRASFTCRGFNYRYATTASPQYFENCELTTQDSYGVDLDDSYVFTRDIDFDFYERAGFGRDCEGQMSRTAGTRYNSLNTADRYGGADDRRFESEKFNEERYKDRYGAMGGPYNKYHTAVRYYPTKPEYNGNKYYSGSKYQGSRYNYGSQYDNYYNDRPYQPYGADCFRFYQKETRLDSRAIRERLQVRDLNECKEECRNSRNFVCRTLAFSSSWFGNDNCYLSDLRANTLDQYDLIYDRSFDIYVQDDFCGGQTQGMSLGQGLGYYPHDNNYDDYGREALYESVSGFPCYRGGCRLDRLGKYYFCETDPTGGWDYCCRPNEYCDQSAGYPIRWCYVGLLGNDQWRPCNMNTVGLRSYLKEGTPDSTKLLDDPNGENSTARNSLEMDHPIELEEITDLALAQRRMMHNREEWRELCKRH